MFRWIKRLFGRKEDPAAAAYYRPRERAIYRYYDGEKAVAADPMVLYMRLMEVHPELIADIKLSRSQHSKAKEGYVGMIAKIRKIFDVKPYKQLGNGLSEGLTEPECTELFAHFWNYCEGDEGEKKNTNLSPTSPEPTSEVSGPSSVASPPTESTSASGSIASELKQEQPVPSSSP